MDIVNIKSESDENDSYSEETYNITSWGADLSFRELIFMYKDEELLKPEIQRNYVWDKTEASRFIESLLMGLPVPSIFLARLPNEKQLIIDGYQRIMTVYDYVMTGIFSKDNKIFKLSNSELINRKWRGKAYSELNPDDQRRIRNTTIHAIIFEQKHPKNDDTSLYQIFERINTSGRTLTPQEIRNCVYQGPFNTSLIELNKHESWRTLFGSKNPDERMRDIEFILRFFALNTDMIRNNKAMQISLKKELNLFMKSDDSQKPEVIRTREETFIKTMDFIYKNMGGNAFHNISKTGDQYIERFHHYI